MVASLSDTVDLDGESADVFSQLRPFSSRIWAVTVSEKLLTVCEVRGTTATGAPPPGERVRTGARRGHAGGVRRGPGVAWGVRTGDYSPNSTGVSGMVSGAALYVATRSSSITPDQFRP